MLIDRRMAVTWCEEIKFVIIAISSFKEDAMKKVTHIHTAKSAKLSTPTDLGGRAREAVSNVINPLIADAFALYVKTKNFHWHVTGSHFRDYHLLLDEQANQVIAMTDVLAERIRKLGGTTIRSIEQISKLKHISDDNDAYVAPKEMISRLLHDNEEFCHAHAGST